MVKRINVSVSDELYETIQQLKQGFARELSFSKIFQEAIEDSIDDVKVRAFVWNYGFSDGIEYVELLSPEDQQKLRKMALNFPRKYPEDLLDILRKADLIHPDSLEKHIDILDYWKCVFKRFEFMENVDESFFEKEGNIDLWEMGGRPIHFNDKEIWEIDSFTSVADIRWEQIQKFWRQGLIAGIKDATKSIEEADDEDE